MSFADIIERNGLFTLPYYLTHYVVGQTPISTKKEVGTALVSYLAIIFGLQEFMKTRQPLKLNGLFRLHNVILTLGSGLLLVCMVEEIIPLIWRLGIFGAACSTEAWTPVRGSDLTSVNSEMNLCAHDMVCLLACGTQRLEFYYIINYYFKYLELIDTVFLVLKKKPLGLSFFPTLRVDIATNRLTARARALVGLQLSFTCTTMQSLLSCALPSSTVALASYVHFSAFHF